MRIPGIHITTVYSWTESMSTKPYLAMCREMPPANLLDSTSWKGSKGMVQEWMSGKKRLRASGITEKVQWGVERDMLALGFVEFVVRLCLSNGDIVVGMYIL